MQSCTSQSGTAISWHRQSACTVQLGYSFYKIFLSFLAAGFIVMSPIHFLHSIDVLCHIFGSKPIYCTNWRIWLVFVAFIPFSYLHKNCFFPQNSVLDQSLLSLTIMDTEICKDLKLTYFSIAKQWQQLLGLYIAPQHFTSLSRQFTMQKHCFAYYLQQSGSLFY